MISGIKEYYESGGEGYTLELEGVMELQENLAGDAGKIRQVFYNLIGNAFRHSSAGVPVKVVVIPGEKTVRIEVRDRGDGIPEEEIAHVFERYYKGKSSNGIKSNGTGLQALSGTIPKKPYTTRV